MTDDNQDNAPNDADDFTIDDVIYWMGWHMDSQRRIYDVLLSVLAGVSDSATAKRLQELHERGEFLYPPAYMRTDDDQTS